MTLAAGVNRAYPVIMIKFLRDRPWIWIIVAFLILITSWTVLLKVAGDRKPASVEIYQQPTSQTTAP